MTNTLDALKDQIEAESLDSAEDLERFRIDYLSKKQGRITHLLKQIPTVPPAERKSYGQAVNRLKVMAEDRLDTARRNMTPAAGSGESDIDVTLPGRRAYAGSIHPITQTRNAIVRVFERFGFTVAEGPEIEDDWHNFTALNFPPEHPARDMQDTLFVEPPSDEHDGILLRTHTSPVQIRVMKAGKPPFRVVVPGRVYRNESISFKSFCLFHQVEGLYVDTGVTLGDLKYTLHQFAQAMFGEDVRMRFRPSFFPFTEPSAEVDIWWNDPGAAGGGRWLEIMGCGMVDPAVLEAVDCDPEKYSGYAFGMGIDRIAMLRHNIKDIRVLFENDIRFLEQF